MSLGVKAPSLERHDACIEEGMTNADARTEMTHASLPNELMAFFQRYADDSLHGQPAAIAAAYAPSFIVAGPKGSQATSTSSITWRPTRKAIFTPQRS